MTGVGVWTGDLGPVRAVVRLTGIGYSIAAGIAYGALPGVVVSVLFTLGEFGYDSAAAAYARVRAAADRGYFYDRFWEFFSSGFHGYQADPL